MTASAAITHRRPNIVVAGGGAAGLELVTKLGDSLGRYSTVGNLMGFVVGRSMFIEGLFARFVYHSIYKMHEAALHGGRVVLWRTLVNLLDRGPTPSVKLH